MTAATLLAGCGESTDRADAGEAAPDEETTTPTSEPTGLDLCGAADESDTDVSQTPDVTVGSLTRDPRGPNTDTRLNDEILTLTSSSEHAVDLSGWTLEDEQGAGFEFPRGSAICRYVVISVHSGQGSNTDVDYFADWGRRWDRERGTVRMLDAEGSVVVECEYTADEPALRC